MGATGSSAEVCSDRLNALAFVNLVVAETETLALRERLAHAVLLPVSSDLTRTELTRLAKRPPSDRLRDDVTPRISLRPRSSRPAARPGDLPSLHGIHPAATMLGDDIEGRATYHELLSDAAREIGVAVDAPV
jgi:hypothetical protein